MYWERIEYKYINIERWQLNIHTILGNQEYPNMRSLTWKKVGKSSTKTLLSVQSLWTDSNFQEIARTCKNCLNISYEFNKKSDRNPCWKYRVSCHCRFEPLDHHCKVHEETSSPNHRCDDGMHLNTEAMIVYMGKASWCCKHVETEKDTFSSVPETDVESSFC